MSYKGHSYILKVCLIISLIIHFILGYIAKDVSVTRLEDIKKPIEIMPIDVIIGQNSKLDKKEIKKIEEKKEEEKNDDEMIFRGTKGQIVDIPLQPETNDIVNSRYLSDRNSKVEKETKSKIIGPKKDNIPQNGANKDIASQNFYKLKKEEHSKLPNIKREEEKKRLKELNKIESQQGEIVSTEKENTTKLSKIKSEQEKITEKDRLEKEGAVNSIIEPRLKKFKIEDLYGNSKEWFRSANNDYLPDVPEGDTTRLNTQILSIGGDSGILGKDTKYYSYFQRIRNTLELLWHPENALKGEKLTKSKFITTLLVTLNRDGSLDNIKILTYSGIDRLDMEAIKSLEKGSPFSNPPEGLIEKDGKIRFPFSFIIFLN